MEFRHLAAAQAAPRLRIRIARTEDQVQQAVAVRYQAYAEKLSGLASDVAIKEDLDRTLNPVILLAEDAASGKVLATARLNSGPGIRDLLAQIELPDEYSEDRLGYFSRMAAIGDPISKKIARGLLHKALLQICMAKQIDRMLLLVGSVRSKLYMPWGFTPVFGSETRPEMMHGRSVNLYQLETRKAEQKALELGGPLHEFLFKVAHEEIEIFNSLSSIPSRQSIGDTASPRRTLELVDALNAGVAGPVAVSRAS